MTLDDALTKLRQACLPEFDGCSVNSVKSTSICGDTPLHIAAIWGDSEMLKALIAAGAALNAKGEQDMTALHYAIEHKHAHCAQVLIDSGCSLTEIERLGLTAKELAEMSTSPAIRELVPRL